MRYLRQIGVIAVKDLRAELRTKEALNASLAFALMILLLFSYTFDPSQEMMREVSGGLLWICFAFAGTLVLNRSFVRELPNDCLDAMIAAPISRAALFLGKALANFAIVMAVELVSMPVFHISGIRLGVADHGAGKRIDRGHGGRRHRRRRHRRQQLDDQCQHRKRQNPRDPTAPRVAVSPATALAQRNGDRAG